jgi:hypothetical protein
MTGRGKGHGSTALLRLPCPGSATGRPTGRQARATTGGAAPGPFQPGRRRRRTGGRPLLHRLRPGPVMRWCLAVKPLSVSVAAAWSPAGARGGTSPGQYVSRSCISRQAGEAHTGERLAGLPEAAGDLLIAGSGGVDDLQDAQGIGQLGLVVGPPPAVAVLALQVIEPGGTPDRNRLPYWCRVRGRTTVDLAAISGYYNAA